VRIPVVKTGGSKFASTLRKIIHRRGEGERKVEGLVGQIIRTVRAKGDSALLGYGRKFEGIRLTRAQLTVKPSEIDRAVRAVSSGDMRAMRQAAKRIADFHRRHIERSWSYRDSLGLTLGQKITPLERVGVYVPGGKALYPSTVLMNVIPAKVAGVKEIIMACPVRDNAAPILAAARIAGVDRVFRIGGAQAIAAMAFGTETVPKVDKIVGPGNIYVATAKRLVFGAVDIDSIAGPSEILILADAGADPAYVAADMLSQAEHDEMAAAFCVTPSLPLAKKVQAALEHQLRTTRRRSVTVEALRRYGAIIVTRGLPEAFEIANAVAPEHIELMVRQPQKWVGSIRHAGAIFIGPYSTPPLGDYMAGPNHVLPTGGSARFFSPLGSYDFVKRTSVIHARREGLRSLAPGVVHLARLEGLYDHARSVEVRFKKENHDGKKRKDRA
jgi:histidinol dehydrogenase